MADDGSSSGRRKVRFTPKAPKSSRKPKLSVAKSEASDEDGEAAQAQYLLSRFNENQTRQRPKVESKTSAQVAFGPGAPASTSLRTYGTKRGESSNRSTESRQRSPDDKDGQMIGSLPLASKEETTDVGSSVDIQASAPKTKREYREPWDYQHTYYPTTLPLRRPYSGDPELLDQEEFVEAAGKEFDEKTINAASDLGLLEESEKGKMFFFQLPSNLPVASIKGKEKAGTSVSSRLQQLPEGGYMGKMLVYKSGAVKLKLGETLFDVSPGSDCTFAEDIAVINTNEKHCCVIGELEKRVVITPDIGSALDSVINLS